MEFQCYPLQFEPILKERIWGGQKLKNVYNKPSTSKTTGESWELSAVEGDVSRVANGPFEGKSLTELLEAYPIEVLGTVVYERFGTQFPLLFKYLDARENLSVQVHPGDELAQQRHNTYGKTEMWYVMQADANARIIVGFEHKSTPEQYLKSLKDKTILGLLHTVDVQQGDVFFLETGTVHAIGAGLVIAEIQQTSDVTYRIYDYDRKDADGNPRQLHVDLALDAINYNLTDTQKKYTHHTNQSNGIVDCPYFTTNFIPLDGEAIVHKDGNSFTVYMCVDGDFEITADGITYGYTTGDTVLIPAALKELKLHGKASLLEIYIS